MKVPANYTEIEDVAKMKSRIWREGVATASEAGLPVAAITRAFKLGNPWKK